jgi:hypothetical protein
MKDLEGRKAMIQVGSGEVFEVDSPKYSDEGAMMLIPHAEGEKEQWTQCSLVSVVKVAGADGVYPADPEEAAKGGKGDESELVAALREALAAKGGEPARVKELEEMLEAQEKGFTAAFEKQRQELEHLKEHVAKLSKPAAGEPLKEAGKTK